MILITTVAKNVLALHELKGYIFFIEIRIMILRFKIFILCLVLQFACKKQSTSSLHSDSGITRNSLDKIYEPFQNLDSSFISFKSFDYNQSGSLLHYLHIKSKNSDINKKIILITGAIHGNEYLNIADRLAITFANNIDNSIDFPNMTNFLRQGGEIVVIPVLNPNGFLDGTRDNRDGIDMNRDFPNAPYGGDKLAPNSHELKNYLQLIVALKKRGKLIFNLDYHCCGSAFYYPLAHANNQIDLSQMLIYKKMGTIVSSLFTGEGIDDETWQPIIGPYKHKAFWETGKTVSGTAQDFFHYQGIYSAVFEGEREKENLKLNQHIKMWEEFFKIFSSPNHTPI